MADTARTLALKNLASTMPVANPQVAQGLQAARQIGMQSSMSQQPAPGQGGAAGVQKSDILQAGAQQAGASGQVTNQVAQQTQAAQTQMAHAATQEQATADEQDLSKKQQSVAALTQKNEASLSALGRDVKSQIYDARMQFAKDKNGQLMLDQQKLADWTVLKAKNQQDFLYKEQQVRQAQERQMEMLKAAHDKVVEQLQIQEQTKEQERNQQTEMRLAQAKQDLEMRIRKQQASQQASQMMFQAGGTVVGAVAGGVVAGPAGAAVGATLGGAAGSIAGSTYSQYN